MFSIGAGDYPAYLMNYRLFIRSPLETRKIRFVSMTESKKKKIEMRQNIFENSLSAHVLTHIG